MESRTHCLSTPPWCRGRSLLVVSHRIRNSRFHVCSGRIIWDDVFLRCCVYCPHFFLLAFRTTLGFGLWLSAHSVQFREVRYTIPFLPQFWHSARPFAIQVVCFPNPGLLRTLSDDTRGRRVPMGIVRNSGVSGSYADYFLLCEFDNPH